MDSGIPFIDLLINFTMSPYSTYFYTGSIHVQSVALRDQLFFLTSLIKLKLGLQKVKDRILLATHADQSKYLANQQQVLGVSLPFASLFILCKMLGGNHFAEPNWHVFTLYMRHIFAGSHTEHCCRSQLTLPFRSSTVLMLPQTT
jgi:hypothetical protein